jgi:hypothetical protein
MFEPKNIDYVTDEKGKKKNVVLKVADFERIREEMEDLEDTLELEKARKNATGFKKWNDFIRKSKRRSCEHGLHRHHREQSAESFSQALIPS